MRSVQEGGVLMDTKERGGLVTMKGNPVTLLGPELKVGDKAPGFRVVDAEFQPVTQADFKGKILLINVVPSLDTTVCALQTRRFNGAIANLPSDIAAITISADLPFAQKRYCEAEKITRMKVLSDHVWRDFGMNYGLLIKGMAILARVILIVNKKGRIEYKQLVPEITEHPDYDIALESIREAIGE